MNLNGALQYRGAPNLSVEMISKHKLAFEVAEWHRSDEWLMFRVGTCHGLWRSTPSHYEILAIDNDNKGNGHFEDVLQFFEESCKRDKRNLRFVEILNPRFLKHLVEKRGFHQNGDHADKNY